MHAANQAVRFESIHQRRHVGGHTMLALGKDTKRQRLAGPNQLEQHVELRG